MMAIHILFITTVIYLIWIFDIFCFAEQSRLIQRSAPLIIEGPQDIAAELDKPIQLHCRAESFNQSLDDLHIDWYKDGKRVTTDPNARIITEFMALHIINTIEQDQGSYYCIAKNSYGKTQSRTALIQFTKLDRDFEIEPQSIAVELYENIRLKCQPPKGTPIPTIYWQKDHKNISLNDNIRLEQNDLIIDSMKHSNFGSYRCLATNQAGKRESKLAIVQQFKKPEIKIKPGNKIDVRRGTNIEIQCQISDNTDSSLIVVWKRVDNKEFRNGIIVKGNILEIQSAQYADTGVYYCELNIQGRLLKETMIFGVYEKGPNNDYHSEVNVTAFIGTNSTLRCHLPKQKRDTVIFWEKVYKSNMQNIGLYKGQENGRFQVNYNDELLIRKIDETDDGLFFCQMYSSSDKKILLGKTTVYVKVYSLEPPPIIRIVPNNQTVPVGVEIIISCQQQDRQLLSSKIKYLPLNDKSDNYHSIKWYFKQTRSKSNRYHTQSLSNQEMLIKFDNKKHKIESNGDLILRHVDKNDTGIYRCLVSNNQGETSWSATLNIEDPRSNAVFQRVETKDLPSAPSQPVAVAFGSDYIELAWSDSLMQTTEGYLIEYFQLTSKPLNWIRIGPIQPITKYIISNLKSGSSYQFIVRALNRYGFGQPSPLSEVIDTRQTTKFISNDHDKVKKVLNSDQELIRLFEPINVQETSVNLKWNVLRNSDLIEKYYVYIVEDGNNQRIETTPEKGNGLYEYIVRNLKMNTLYQIKIIPYKYDIQGKESNTIYIKTPEGPPSAPPDDVIVELTGLNSLSIKWNPPSLNHQNGQIIAYKVNCLGNNETTSIRLHNISSEAKGLHIKSLFENLQYCISVAAKTKAGDGPYTEPKCVIMNSDFLKRNRNGLGGKLRMAIDQPWFIPVIILSSLLFVCLILSTIWLCFKRYQTRKTYGSDQFVELPIHKTSNGTRYNLIKDPLWTDSLRSTSNLGSGPSNFLMTKCCTAGSSASDQEQQQPMFIHKNPINALLQECNNKNLTLSDHSCGSNSLHHSIKTNQNHNNDTTITTVSPDSSPQYTEINNSNNIQQTLNPYATTGLFSPCNGIMNGNELPTYNESLRTTNYLQNSLPSSPFNFTTSQNSSRHHNGLIFPHSIDISQQQKQKASSSPYYSQTSSYSTHQPVIIPSVEYHPPWYPMGEANVNVQQLLSSHRQNIQPSSQHTTPYHQQQQQQQQQQQHQNENQQQSPHIYRTTCIHCSHPHTPSSIRTSARSPSSHSRSSSNGKHFRHNNRNKNNGNNNTNNNNVNSRSIDTDVRWNNDHTCSISDSLNSNHDLTKSRSNSKGRITNMNSKSESIKITNGREKIKNNHSKRNLKYQLPNEPMLNSHRGETMITSWTSVTDGSNPESSSSNSDNNDVNHDHSRTSSEGSIFTDSDLKKITLSFNQNNQTQQPNNKDSNSTFEENICQQRPLSANLLLEEINILKETTSI